MDKIKNFSGYTDLDLTFAPHPAKKDLMISTGELAVVRALKNLLLTKKTIPFAWLFWLKFQREL